MRKFCIVLAAVALSAVSCINGSSLSNEIEAQEEEVKNLYMGFDPDLFDSEEGKVRSGETFPGLLMRLGMDKTPAYEMVQVARDSFDVRKMRADAKVVGYYTPDTLHTLSYVVYSHDRIHSTVFKCVDSLSVWGCDRPTHSEVCTSDVTITSSLWNDMLEEGTSPLLIVELADIYAWTINFFALHSGDRFRVLYSQSLTDENEVVAIDSVMFSIYDSGDFQSVAVRYDQGDGGNKYWNEKGESMRKAFLKAPLKYNRISSRFSYSRKHPVTGKVKAHTAVDYAAPKGTPVHSIGDGTIILCGWDNTGGGNRIKIRHMNGYETSYMHLSGFAKGIKTGVRVAQGQLIGYVGSTGTSTGPHLDFRVWKDKTPIDPLKMIAPPTEPLKSEHLDSLGKVVEMYMQQIAQ